MKKLANMIGTPMPSSGPVTLLRDQVKDNWCSLCRVLQYGAGFQIYCDSTQGGKMTLAPEDGLWLIEELKLGAHTTHPFRRAVTWRD